MSRPLIQVELSRRFIKRLKRLQKRYANAAADVQELIVQLEQGETPGNQISGVGYTVYKTRLRNRDVGRGKSGGYRVIYYIRTSDRIILLLIYSKSDQVDVSTDELQRIIEELL